MVHWLPIWLFSDQSKLLRWVSSASGKKVPCCAMCNVHCALCRAGCAMPVCDGNIPLCAMCWCMAGYTMAQIVFGQVCDGSNFLCGKNLMKKSEAGSNAQLILKTQSNSLGNSSISFIKNSYRGHGKSWDAHEEAMGNFDLVFGVTC